LMDFRIRVGNSGDLPFLRAMLYEAAYWDLGKNRPSHSEGLARPDLVYLLQQWGRPGDCAVVAQSPDNARLGAAWYRLWTVEQHSYGFVDERTPEIAIAVEVPHRRQGIGRALLSSLVQQAVEQGFDQLSLSVETENGAHKLYRKTGFREYLLQEGSWIMVLRLPQCLPSEHSAPKRRSTRSCATW